MAFIVAPLVLLLAFIRVASQVLLTKTGYMRMSAIAEA